MIPDSALLDPASEVFYDLETQLSADDVGGWQNSHLMRVALAVTWCARHGVRRWDESSVKELIEYLTSFARIVSFNGDNFDSRVLSFYGDVRILRSKSFDVLVDLTVRLGHRVSLDALASATLGRKKTADGLAAIRWWKAGRLEELAAYCENDVGVLRDIVAYGRHSGHVRYLDRSGVTRSVSVEW
ncbi:MAG: helicase [Ignavibacteria bacterium]|nr:helicase [Ignavibacteria bacterium]